MLFGLRVRTQPVRAIPNRQPQSISRQSIPPPPKTLGGIINLNTRASGSPISEEIVEGVYLWTVYFTYNAIVVLSDILVYYSVESVFSVGQGNIVPTIRHACACPPPPPTPRSKPLLFYLSNLVLVVDGCKTQVHVYSLFGDTNGCRRGFRHKNCPCHLELRHRICECHLAPVGAIPILGEYENRVRSVAQDIKSGIHLSILQWPRLIHQPVLSHPALGNCSTILMLAGRQRLPAPPGSILTPLVTVVVGLLH